MPLSTTENSVWGATCSSRAGGLHACVAAGRWLPCVRVRRGGSLSRKSSAVHRAAAPATCTACCGMRGRWCVVCTF
eukprot:6266577-Prymnesium_polylepis.1